MIQKENLYEQVEKYLIDLICENLSTPNYRLPTEAELTKQFHISRVTVNTAFKRLEEKKFLYRIQGKGTFIHYEESPRILEEQARLTQAQPQKKGKIALIVPSVNSAHIMGILEGVLKACRDQTLLIGSSENSQDREETLITRFVDEGCEGILLYPTDYEKYRSILLHLTLSKYPIILIDRYLPGLSLNLVSSDNESAFLQATKSLVGNGHTHIAFISVSAGSISTLSERLSGYEKALEETNIPSAYKLTRASYPDSASVEEKLDRLFRETPQLTALISAHHFSSCTTETYLVASGRKDLYQTVYTDLDCMLPFPYLYQSLTHIQQNSEEIGRTAFELLQRTIRNRSGEKEEIRIPASFHIPDELST